MKLKQPYSLNCIREWGFFCPNINSHKIGTLFHQTRRDFYRISKSDIKAKLEILQDIEREEKIPLDSLIQLYRVLELGRQNEFFADNGDRFDEEIAGIGELFKELNSKLEEIASSIYSQKI